MCLWFVQNQSIAVPLTKVEVNAKILDVLAQVEIVQVYVNKETSPIEAVYKFPLNANAAVFSFSAFIDGKEIKGTIKEKEEARNQYDNALASGHGAYLLEQDMDETFVCNVGSLPPGKEATIKICYVTELSMVSEELEFVLPVTIASSASKPPPPSFGFSNITFSNPMQQVNYSMKFTIDLELSSDIVSIGCETHPISINFLNRLAKVSLSSLNQPFTKDFVLKLKTKDPFTPRAWVENENGNLATMLAFYPKFESLDDFPMEMVFVVDQSGSMSGPKIQQAKNSLQLFLRSLPQSCLFNIVSFGSNFRSLFPESAPYNNETLTRATNYVKSIDANLGGTEILNPLKKILETPAHIRYPRQIMLLTDGQVPNNEEIIDFVKKHCNTTRVFTFGIGNDVSKELIKGVARAGNGKFEFVSLEERMEEKVMKQLESAISPGLTNLRLDWGNVHVDQAPTKLKVMFTGSLLLVYGFLKPMNQNFEVNLQAESPHGPVTFKIPVSLQNAIPSGSLIHRLGARALITELMDKDLKDQNVTKQIKELGLKYSLVSRFTSFVAIEKRTEESTGTMQLREIPVVFAKEPNQSTSLFGAPISNSFAFNSSPQPAFGSGSGSTAFSFGSSSTTGGFGGNFGGTGTRTTNSTNSLFAPTSAPNTYSYSSNSNLVMQPVNSPSFSFGAPPPQVSSAFGSSPSGFSFAPNSNPSTKPRSDLDKVTSLISLQNADGSWALNQALASEIGISLDQLSSALKSNPGMSGTVWGTSIAIAFLEVLFGHTKLWVLSAERGKKWISNNSSPGGKEGWKSWVSMATTAVKGWNLKPF